MKLTDRKRNYQARRDQAKGLTACDLQTHYDRVMALARGLEQVGDRIDAERFYQQADHYRRMLNEKADRTGSAQ